MFWLHGFSLRGPHQFAGASAVPAWPEVGAVTLRLLDELV
jgi:hypothetical protein